MQGRGSGKVRDFALYGETTGETDEFGLPVRYNWAAEYRGAAMVVYGHTPVPEPEWLNRTVNIDTGCVFGGKLTALRYPEKEFVSVPAARTYCEPARPFLEPGDSRRRRSRRSSCTTMSSMRKMSLASGSSRRGCDRSVTIREENAAAALEVMSRFAANPKWLIYLSADDVAVRDDSDDARTAGAPGSRRSPTTAMPGSAARHLRREAHGFARSSDRLP